MFETLEYHTLFHAYFGETESGYTRYFRNLRSHRTHRLENNIWKFYVFGEQLLPQLFMIFRRNKTKRVPRARSCLVRRRREAWAVVVIVKVLLSFVSQESIGREKVAFKTQKEIARYESLFRVLLHWLCCFVVKVFVFHHHRRCRRWLSSLHEKEVERKRRENARENSTPKTRSSAVLIILCFVDSTGDSRNSSSCSAQATSNRSFTRK